ncbi:retron St85 family RNA-directed DNA polymerase [Alcaligenes nematophilus]
MSNLIDKMSISLGAPRQRLLQIIRTSPLRYKVFYILKKTGGRRKVAQPAKEVKAIQRWLIGNVLSGALPVHDAATAYSLGKSIKKNAEAHAENSFLLKMDFKDFFPSISEIDIKKHFNKYLSDSYTKEDIAIVVRTCVWAPDGEYIRRLCIGAPTSPLISNSIMYEFDEAISEYASQEGVVYTRYADDLTFSCNQPDVLKNYPILVANLLSKLDYENIRINVEKTVHASKSGRRMVTGLVLTSENKVSIGRDRKRLIRSMYHRYLHEQLAPEDIPRLMGLINFAEDVEPGFHARLRKMKK